MKRYPILIIAWLGLPLPARAETLSDKLTAALKAYCVPRRAEMCSSTMRPRYQNGTCYCGDPTYMYYDATAETCRVKCPAGQMPEKTSGGCQGGYGGIIVKDF